MKQLFLIVILAINLNAFAQDNKTVTLTVSAQGKTKSEAKQNALRDAIEQAFGTFISSNTEILNEELVKDEIVSVSNGNIQDYKVTSEVQLPDSSYSTTLNVTVSINKLTSFAESKGANIEFKGGLFAVNMIQQELNEKAELKAVKNIIKASKSILQNSFDYSIESSSSPIKDGVHFKIPLTIKIKLNDNFDAFRKYFNISIRQLSMSPEEVKSYLDTGKSFDLLLSYNEDNKANPPQPVYFRNKNSTDEVNAFIISIRELILNFEIRNGVNVIAGNKLIPKSNSFNYNEISEYYRKANIYMVDVFRIFIRHFEYEAEICPSLFDFKSVTSMLAYDKNGIDNSIIKLHKPLNTTILKRFKFSNNHQKNIYQCDRNIILNFYDFYSQELEIGYRTKSLLKKIMPNELFNEKSIIWIYFYDTKTLDEIKQISEYTIKPILD